MKTKNKWTLFWDMHSGGGSKERNYDLIFIELPEEKAKVFFYNRFGHNPERVSCTCCGQDYSISEEISLKRATGFHRNCPSLETPRDKNGLYQNDLEDEWFKEHYYLDNLKELKEAEKRGFKLDSYTKKEKFKQVVPLTKFVKNKDVLVIYKKDIKKSELKGSVPTQGYVYID